MQKKTPTYDLSRIKKAFDKPSKLVMTSTARQGQVALDFSDDDVVAVIQSLSQKNFYKTMAPERIKFIAWQDVYITHFKGFELYIKFQVNNNEELILSFKEK